MPNNETENGHGPEHAPAALMLLRAQTELHPGGGAPYGTIDRAVQREVQTTWPMIAFSGAKGTLREQYREYLLKHKPKLANRREADKDEDLVAIFGKAEADGAGALMPIDLYLLAYPVASGRGVFAWVTCAGVVERLRRALRLAGLPKAAQPPALAAGLNRNKRNDMARVTTHSEDIVMPEFTPGTSRRVRLRDIECELDDSAVLRAPLDKLADWIADNVPEFNPAANPPYDLFDPRARFVQVSDNIFTFLTRYGTNVVAHIALDTDTRTVARGALFTQELLPAESIFWGTLLNPARTRAACDVIGELKKALSHGWMQIGADAGTGKGLTWVALRTPDELGAAAVNAEDSSPGTGGTAEAAPGGANREQES